MNLHLFGVPDLGQCLFPKQEIKGSKSDQKNKIREEKHCWLGLFLVNVVQIYYAMNSADFLYIL